MATVATPSSMDTKTLPVLYAQTPVRIAAIQPAMPDEITPGATRDSNIVPGRASMNFLNLPVVGNRQVCCKPFLYLFNILFFHLKIELIIPR